MPPHNNFWTAERIAIATRMWAEGASGDDIARELHTTRCAVLGKLSRLNLQRKGAENIIRTPRKGRPRTYKPRVAPPEGETRPRLPRLIPLTPPPERGEHLGLLDLLDGMCKFPIGDPVEPDFHFCGHAQRPGAPYCPYHCQVAYRPLSEARKPDPNWRGRTKIPTSLLRYV